MNSQRSGWQKKAFIAVFCTLAPFASPVRADSVSTSASDGFGRILFTLDPVAHGTVSVAGGVLTLHFNRKVTIDPNAMAQGLSAYVSSVRGDPDGQTFRLALTQEIKPHTSTSGDRLALDLAPATFNGAPPDLPQPPPKDAPVDVSRLPVLAIRAGSYPNYSRLVFDWPQPVKYAVFPAHGHLTVRFSSTAKPDFTALERIAPPWVKHGGWHVDSGATTLEFEIDPDSAHKISVDGNKLVLDILAPKGDAAAKQATKLSGVTPAQSDAVLAAARQVNDGRTAKASTPPEKAAVAQMNSAAVQTPVAGPNQTAPAIGPKNIVPNIAPPLPTIAAVSAARTTDGASMVFPGARTIAAFIRADTAWIVSEGGTAPDLPALQSALGDFPASVQLEKNGDATILRIGLKQAEQIAAQVQGKAIAVTIAPKAQARIAPIAFTRNDDEAKHAALAAMVPGAVHRMALTDPVVGDTLVIVPSQPGNGLRAPHNYIEFTALPSAAGLVIAPASDDLDITVGKSRVSITQATGLTLTPPANPVPGSPSAFARNSDTAGFIDFAHWGQVPTDKLLHAQQALRQRAASATPADAFQGRVALARFDLVNGFGAEALGLVHLMEANDPSLQTNPQIRILRAAADYMMGRYSDARSDLANPVFDNNRHAALWRGLTEAALENWTAASPIIGRYPAEWRARAEIANANALLATGNIESANAALKKIPDGLSKSLELEAQLVEAQLLSKSGQGRKAEAIFAAVETGGDERASAEAVYDDTVSSLSEGRISTAAGIDALQKLRFRWRGDALELKTLRKLGSLFFAAGKWREGLQMLRIASQQFPEDDQGRMAQDEMRATFDRLFLKGGADKLSPIQSLAVFYDFVELTPIGPKGDEMIRRMADRLIAVDLLGPAARLLKYQVENRLDGVARAQVATRLATLDLLDHRPKDALEALHTTRISGIPDEVNHQRMSLEAQALAALKQWDRALDTLAVDNAADTRKLRADIYWTSGNWELAGEKSEELVSTAANAATMPQEDRDMLMRAAIAYSLASNQPALNRLRDRFGAKLQGSADASAFAVISQKPDTQGATFKDVAARIASVDTLQAFMTDFRKQAAVSN